MDESIPRQIAHLPITAAANTTHTMNGVKLKSARHVLLEKHAEGTYIFRYDEEWGFSGDTWHASTEDALAQIQWEFGVDHLDWRHISETELTALTNSEKN